MRVDAERLEGDRRDADVGEDEVADRAARIRTHETGLRSASVTVSVARTASLPSAAPVSGSSPDGRSTAMTGALAPAAFATRMSRSIWPRGAPVAL